MATAFQSPAFPNAPADQFKTPAPAPQAPAPVKSVAPISQPTPQPSGIHIDNPLAIEKAQAQEPPAAPKPIFKGDRVTQMRKTMDDSVVLQNLYHADPAFKAAVDQAKPYYDQQSPDWQQNMFPTAMLDEFYSGGQDQVPDPQTAALLSNMTNPQAQQPTWWQTAAQHIFDMTQAPGNVAAGLLEKGLGANTQDTRDLGKNADTLVNNLNQYGGMVGSAFGPVGTGAGTAIGAGVTNMIHEMQGKRDTGNTAADVAGPLVQGAIAGGAHFGIQKIANAIGSANGPSSAIEEPAANELPPHAVQPKLSAADLKKMVATPSGAKMVEQGAGNTGIISNSTGPALSSDEQSLHELAKTLPGYGQGEGAVAEGKAMTPDAALHNASVVSDSLSQEAGSLDQSLAKNNFLIPQQESSSAVGKALEAARSEAPEDTKAYDSAKTIWDRIRSQYDGNAVGEREARKAFDSYVTDKWGPKIFEKGTPQADAIRTVREASNNLIQKYAAQNGLDYTASLKRMSGMYDLLDNLSTHVTPDVFKSTVSRFLSKPIVKAAAKGLGLAGGMEAATHIIP